MATGRLAQVEQDAIRITEKRFRDQEEERIYQESKLKGGKSADPAPGQGMTYEPALEKESKK